MNNEIRELTIDELDIANGTQGKSGSLSFGFGYGEVQMTWDTACKSILITGNNGQTNYASTC
jgi:hypothetical protein